MYFFSCNTLLLALASTSLAMPPTVDPQPASEPGDVDCGGTTACKNDQHFRDDCAAALDRFRDEKNMTFTVSSRLCWDSCIITFEGYRDSNRSPCRATPKDVSDSWGYLLGHNCSGCGNVRAPAGGDCRVHFDNWECLEANNLICC
jgi:hypothetical protein